MFVALPRGIAKDQKKKEQKNISERSSRGAMGANKTRGNGRGKLYVHIDTYVCEHIGIYRLSTTTIICSVAETSCE